MKYTCINVEYSDFINKLMKVIDNTAPFKKEAMQKGGKLCRYKNSDLDKRDLKKMLYRQKSSKKEKLV